ncbi:DUF2779 domain-containing protein [Sulfurimonas sp.]|uniref:DUF2779 domain-containing protein n=1 Tax=Sulfurimonas sp. TaxID=2022749 RepID=UPI003563CB0A
MRLSKSLYTRGLQCVKSLWLKKYNKEILTPPDSSAEAIFERGNEVGALACQLFPNGIEIEFNPSDYDGMINTTKTLIDDGVNNIYEASFNYDDIFVAVDILHINDDDSVEIYEVKSSTDVKDVYKHDASIQYYVLKGLGFKVKKVSIIHINNKYVRDEELEIDKLFTIADITEEVLELQEDIPTYLRTFKTFLDDKENEPEKEIGVHCSNPYDCDAIAYCWSHIPKYSIFNISRLNAKKKFELYNQGIINFTDIADISSFSTAQQVQIESEVNNKTIINNEAIKDFLGGLTYPIYHLDFETFQQAIPEWKGISPFMQIPFQYSVHVQHEDGNLEHKEHLAKDGFDPRYELAKKLVEDIPTDVTVLAYNMGFEKGVIRKLAEQFDDFAHHLMCIHDNIQDLMTPFQKKDYYTPSMRGGYSIKKVLPALVPDMEKAYKELSLVHNGGEAMQTFARLSKMDDTQKSEYRNALLEYCKLDTLAMVKVLDKLKETSK